MRRKSNKLYAGILVCALILTALFISTGTAFAADEAYIMGYFAENGNYGAARYALHLAYSYDGLNFVPLNQNNAVAIPTLGNQGLRDPFILRKQDGNFVVIATDMKGIDMMGNRSKYLQCWDSNDGLQTFTNYRLLQVHNWSNTHAWAPEAFWDPNKKQYAVMWASNSSIYVNYTTDFKTVTDVNNPTVFHNPGYMVYDGDMTTYNGMNYFYTANGAIHGWKSSSLNPGSFTSNYVPSLNPAGAIEAPTVVQKIGTSTFWLWGDSYSPVNALFYVYQTNDISTDSWKVLDRRLYEGPPLGKHNTICKVSLAELDKIIKKWGNPNFQRIKSYSAPEKMIRHANNVGKIDTACLDPIVDSYWKVVSGLADSKGISFESVSKPGYYLRQSNSSIVLNSNDNSSTFKADATFYKVSGFADSSWTSFRSYVDPDKYLRQSNNNLRIDPISTATEKQDATFKIFYDPSDLTPPTYDPISAFTKVEAESYNEQSGVQSETCTEGGYDVGYIENGDYTVYKNIDFGTGAASFKARVSSATSGGKIEIRLDSVTGTLVGTCPVTATGDWQTWVDATCSVSGVSGKHDLYLKFTGGSGYLFNFNWFQFSKETMTPTLTGDLNGDGNVDVTDYALMKKYLLGIINDFPVENDIKAGDVNGDGVINALDFAVFKKYLLGTISKLPYSL